MTIEMARLEDMLDGAALLGAELDLRYRVLAITAEPAAGRHPEPATASGSEVGDRRLQVLCFPVSTILASLRREVDGRRLVETFETEQLLEVVAAFEGARLAGPVFGRPEPRPGEWGPDFSLQGRSSAPNGTLHTIVISVATDEASLEVFARFDEVELKDPAGEQLELPA